MPYGYPRPFVAVIAIVSRERPFLREGYNVAFSSYFHLMKVKFHKGARERSFRSDADFAAFAIKQAEMFDELQKSDAARHAWAGSIASQWRNASRVAKDQPEQLQGTLNNGPVFTYKSHLGRAARALAEEGRHNVASAFREVLQLQFETNNTQIRSLHGIAMAVVNIAIALEANERPTARYGSMDAMLRDHEDRLQSMLEDDASDITEKRSSFDEMLEETKQQASDAISKIRGDIQAYETSWLETHDRFVKQLETSTAVELWQQRATDHEKRYGEFRKLSIAYGAIGLLVFLVWIFAGFAFARWAFPNGETAQLASYTAGSLAVFTLYVWGLRVFVRSMVSEDHLKTDASARSALAHTYLAMIENETANDSDRAIVLAALFAPVSDGLIKDDGMPAFSPMAIAAQSLTNPKP